MKGFNIFWMIIFLDYGVNFIFKISVDLRMELYRLKFRLKCYKMFEMQKINVKDWFWDIGNNHML